MTIQCLLKTENIKQMIWGAINGCEAASLLEGLHYQNRLLTVNYGEFLMRMPISSEGNPYRGFGGSPFKNQSGKFEAIFPHPLASWGRQFGALTDLSGATSGWLYDSVCHKRPVVTYVTVHFEAPQWVDYPFGRVPQNNHAVLLDGVSEDRVHVSDPIDGQYWLKKILFEKIYNARQMAVSVDK